jgi:lipoprotein-anchoring transpeptidase ErfK/SrfK
MAGRKTKSKQRRGKSRKTAVALVLGLAIAIFGIWVSPPGWLPVGGTFGPTNSPPVFRPEVAQTIITQATVRPQPQSDEKEKPVQPTPAPVLPPPVAQTSTAPNPQPVQPPAVVAKAVPVDLSIYPRPPQNVFEAQVALARQGISAGAVDGLIGSQTRAALAAFQRAQGLPVTGELGPETQKVMSLETDPLTRYTITAEDLARLQPLSASWLGKSQQSALEFETILELVSEKWRAHPNCIRKLNPGLDWQIIQPGTTVTVPDTAMPIIRKDASFIGISLSQRLLQVFTAETNLLAHFPCSIAQRVEKRPIGDLRVVAIAPDPNYTFNPDVFPESAEARQIGRKLILPPGPNNPVGVAWISLNKPGYGIHGTPQPEQVGRTESHGCFRLANWNAAHLLQLVRVGMPVYVQP